MIFPDGSSKEGYFENNTFKVDIDTNEQSRKSYDRIEEQNKVS
jgi:hypothetical protein